VEERALAFMNDNLNFTFRKIVVKFQKWHFMYDEKDRHKRQNLAANIFHPTL